MYDLATNTADQGLWNGWKKYQKKEERNNFQIDMAILLIDMGVKNDWNEDYDDSNKPEWMQRLDPLPCYRNKCMYCKLGKTRPPVMAEEPTRLQKKKLCPECNDIPMKLDETAKSAEYCRVCYYRVGQINSRA